MEAKVYCHDTAGAVEVRINGVTVVNLTGVNTKAGSHAYHDTVAFGLSSPGTAYYYDDLYVCDGSGSANNDFLGGVRVARLNPETDTAVKDWTPKSGGNHTAMVQETVCDDDTNYVEDSTSGHTDIFDYTATPSTIASAIAGVQINTDCRQTDATPFSLKTVIVSGGTQDDGSAATIGTQSYTTRRRVSEVNPDTGLAWTKTAIDAAQFGIKVG